MSGTARRWALALVLLLAVAVVRVGVESAVELSHGRAALAEGDDFIGVLHLERAVHWYLPGSPTVRRAAAELEAVGERAEQAGDRELALWAYRSLRSGLYATRSLWTPMPRTIARMDERIATLMAADPEATWPERTLSDTERRDLLLGQLREPTGPRTLPALAATIGFLGWLAGGIGLFTHGARPTGGWHRRRALAWLATIAAGQAVWILGMLLA